MLTIYSGDNCPRCERVKRLLKLAQVEFRDVPAGIMAAVHDGWRADGSVDLLAWRTVQSDGLGDQLPIIKRDGADYENHIEAQEYALDEATAFISKKVLDSGAMQVPGDYAGTLRSLLARLAGLPYRIDVDKIDKVVRAGGRCPCVATGPGVIPPQCPCPSHKRDIESSGMCGCELLHQAE